MSKIKYLAKDAAKKHNIDIIEYPEEYGYFMQAFQEGFDAAIKTLKEEATNKIAHLEQYPMMTERIFALKTYMDKMDEMLKEMK
jgi:hypothetical protein